ncbi:MAG: hypothetical protein WD768_02585, partial [Phycisphaeraceae bacterium]
SIMPASLTDANAPGEVTAKNYSFAMLELASKKARNAEWYFTTNSLAAVISDRNIGTDADAGARSVAGGDKPWQGAVAYNDNHIKFETTHILANLRYGDRNPNVLKDNLFKSGDALRGESVFPEPDALMTYKGNNDGGVNQKP